MFVTIITIIILTFVFVLWAIVYGGSKNISEAEREFNNRDEIIYLYDWELEQQEKYNRKLLKKILRKLNKKK